MATAIPKDSLMYAGKLLDKLRELDSTVHAAYYDMGRILSSIQHGKLYDALGYESMGHLITEELSFSTSTAFKYLHTYRNFRRLGYTKTEAMELIEEHSFSYMSKVLPTLKGKVGKRGVANAVTQMLKQERQINFSLSEDELGELTEVLESFGAERTELRLMHSSAALMEMARFAKSKA